MLEWEDLLVLERELREALDERLEEILTRLNRDNKLEELLHLLGLSDLLAQDPGYQVYKEGKIVVLGQTDVKPDALLGIGKDLGLPKNRFELHLEYEDAKRFDITKLQWDPAYSVILVGPMPHSGAGKGDHGSVIAALEHTAGYPPVVRLGSNGLKITKTDFRKKLEELLASRKIA